MQTPNASLLQFKNVTKRFGNSIAVNDVSFNVGSHSVVALLGENGAGKSTLIKTLAGIYQEDQGEILYQGTLLDQKNRHHDDIAFIHQDLGLVDWMTVSENMALAMGYCKKFGLIDWQATDARAAEALASVNANIDPRTRVFRLSRAEQSLIAIARAVYCKAKILVLDEPTASLPAADVERLFGVIRDLRQKGVGMIYVSHRLDEVMEISDSMVIMRDGLLVAECPTKGMQAKDLVELIVGNAQKDFHRQRVDTNAATVLDVTDFEAGNVGPVSFHVKQGEILGLIGLRGGGQGEVGRALFGDYPIFNGQVRLDGQLLNLNSTTAAIQAGIGYVAGERGENLAMSMSVQDNFFINPLLGETSFFALNALSKEQGVAEDLIDRFDVRPRNPNQTIENLSGGNQQKVIMARWLNLNKRVLILDEPTAGVDVGAKAEIYNLLKTAVSNGLTVILVSTDFEEIEKICNRCYVFSKGFIHKELAEEDMTFANMLKVASADGD
ncbi:hypothetical protein OA79_09000 [Marinomonas sp. TW1]|nr:hypothetical protein OA79_09000 [Marinomonas sp. TW1]